MRPYKEKSPPEVNPTGLSIMFTGSRESPETEELNI